MDIALAVLVLVVEVLARHVGQPDLAVVPGDGDAGDVRAQVKDTGTRLDASLQTLDQTLASLRLTSDEAGYALSEQSPVFHELTRTAAELGRAGRALQALADALAREPESLLRGRSEGSDE